ncbi:MAG: T9SS type A sorting domain-containing protein [Flavobacteriales bacterium]|nr:T9SS type A sorting domain-containing protein [Flavobacteriales bacterium]
MAQISAGGDPYSLRNGLPLEQVPTVQAPAFDTEAIAAEDNRREQEGRLPLYGRVLDLDVDPWNSGEWMELPNGDRIWRVKLISPGALATELFFKDCFIPSGAVMFVWNLDHSEVIGGFTSANNKASGVFGTAQLTGEGCFVEYFEPLAVAGTGSFRITGIGHAYRFVGEEKAGDCQVDVNCAPEGNGQTKQRDGVVRISVKVNGQLGWCTGSLINNLAFDCKPYFLTADHCQRDGSILASTSDLADWRFYFKYQRSGCGTGNASAASSVIGCQRRADSNDLGGTYGSDFCLVEGDDAIPTNYNPYWFGWDANEFNPGSGAKCIHHPAGDEKKISTVNTVQSSTFWNGVNNPYATHYRVTWSATTNGHGVTEGGSSGSPLYNSSGLIVGTLTGGSSYCNSQQPGGQNQPDFYGKMSFHWEHNGGPASDDLKNWLDPNGTGQKICQGSYGPCGTIGMEEQQLAAAPVLAPNPTNGVVRITLTPDQEVERVELHDLSGRLLRSEAVNGRSVLELDLGALRSGLYLVSTVERGARSKAARLDLVH